MASITVSTVNIYHKRLEKLYHCDSSKLYMPVTGYDVTNLFIIFMMYNFYGTHATYYTK